MNALFRMPLGAKISIVVGLFIAFVLGGAWGNAFPTQPKAVDEQLSPSSYVPEHWVMFETHVTDQGWNWEITDISDHYVSFYYKDDDGYQIEVTKEDTSGLWNGKGVQGITLNFYLQLDDGDVMPVHLGMWNNELGNQLHYFHYDPAKDPNKIEQARDDQPINHNIMVYTNAWDGTWYLQVMIDRSESVYAMTYLDGAPLEFSGEMNEPYKVKDFVVLFEDGVKTYGHVIIDEKERNYSFTPSDRFVPDHDLAWFGHKLVQFWKNYVDPNVKTYLADLNFFLESQRMALYTGQEAESMEAENSFWFNYREMQVNYMTWLEEQRFDAKGMIDRLINGKAFTTDLVNLVTGFDWNKANALEKVGFITIAWFDFCLVCAVIGAIYYFGYQRGRKDALAKFGWHK